MRKVTVTGLLVAVLLLTNNAFAGLILPESTYEGGRWQGYRIYEQDGYNMLLDFAVYDTQGVNGNEFANANTGFTTPGDGRYIYAYQIFNHPDASEVIESFAIFPLGGGEIDPASISGLGSQNDNDGGMAPESVQYADQNSKIVWMFGFGNEGSPLGPGFHSYFLLFSSDSAPVVGDYTIDEEIGDVPGMPQNPEPATVILLGTGAVLAVLRRRQSK